LTSAFARSAPARPRRSLSGGGPAYHRRAVSWVFPASGSRARGPTLQSTDAGLPSATTRCRARYAADGRGHVDAGSCGMGDRVLGPARASAGSVV